MANFSEKQIAHEERLAAYNQNSEHFRSLNQLMWKIPIIGMTLTGGLWFGVSKVNTSPGFQVSLLLLALAGNIGLAIILWRLRFIMQRHLDWLKKFGEENFVDAHKGGCITSSKTVQRSFQALLFLAAILSGLLMIKPSSELLGGCFNKSVGSIPYYNELAEQIADSYEALSFKDVHPFLYNALSRNDPKTVLDVGSGTGRDAAWISDQGHKVTAIEPSSKMLTLAKRIHPDVNINWVNDSLPELQSLKSNGAVFDLIIVSAVWMHIHPKERKEALARLASLLSKNGIIYLTLRLGPSNPEKTIFKVSMQEIQRIAKMLNLKVATVSTGPDLLSRENISWKSVTLTQIEA